MADSVQTEKDTGIVSALLSALTRSGRGAGDFVVRVYEKAGQDDIFFLAGGIAFNILVAAIPFLLLIVAIFGFVLKTAIDDPQQAAIEYVATILPASREVREYTSMFVDEIISGRTRFGLLGLVLFVWTSTRLIGTLRSVLRHIFDLQQDRGIVAGKIFDAKMVIVAGSLFLANTGITAVLEAIQAFGTEWTGLALAGPAQALYAQLLAFGFIFLMFVLIYRFLPFRRIPWRVALVAATFTAVVWELLKSMFAWYVANVANYTSTYGNVATLIVLVFWIYYSAVVFILGGEVGQVYDMYRVRRKQKELLE